MNYLFSIFKRSNAIFKLLGIFLIVFLPMGCSTMDNLLTQPLTFKKHGFAVNCYSARDVQVIYGYIANSSYSCGAGKIARAKRVEDEKRYWGGTGGIPAFTGPAKIHWYSKDGAEHAYQLSLDEVFKGKKILHTEDPTRIAQYNPPTEPIIIVEVNDRTLNVYMDTFIYLIADPNVKGSEESRNIHLAFTKKF